MNSEPISFPFRVMGGPGELQLYADSRAIAQVVADRLIDEARRIEEKYSRYKPTTILSIINQAAGGAAIEVDEETAGLINYAFACYEQSEGLFDISSGVLRRAWDFKKSELPSPESIAALLPLIGMDNIEWRTPNIRLLKPEMEIDFGGIAKEYAVDRMAAIGHSLGIAAGLINLAGDLRAIGAKPGNTPWHVGITHPRRKGGVIATVDLAAGALATSGDYERFIEVNGKRYCHILNPRTGFPIQRSFQSVTVFAKSCLIAGSATTISMLLGERDGLKFLKGMELSYLAVSSEGEIISNR